MCQDSILLHLLMMANKKEREHAEEHVRWGDRVEAGTL